MKIVNPTFHMYVRRKMDRGYRKVPVYVHYWGMPEFAERCIPAYLFMLEVEELVYCSGNEPIAESYHIVAKEVLERLLSP